MWAPFEKRLADSRIALLTSAGLFLKSSQRSFDLDREQMHPEWGDPTWRAIPADSGPEELGVAHLHINDEDVLADPEIALPMHLLSDLASEGVIGGTVDEHVSVMGYQDRDLPGWQRTTAPEITAHLREQGADAVVLAPA